MAKFRLVYAFHFSKEVVLAESDKLSELFLSASSFLNDYSSDFDTFLKHLSYFQIEDYEEDCLLDLHLMLLENKGFLSFSELSNLFY